MENKIPIFYVTLITFKQTISPVLKMGTYSEEQQYDVGKKKKKWYRRLNEHPIPPIT